MMPHQLYSISVAHAEAIAAGRHERAALIADGTIVPAGTPSSYLRPGVLHMRPCDFAAALRDCIDGEWGELECELRLFADPLARPLIKQ